jgi:hypothetical protein
MEKLKQKLAELLGALKKIQEFLKTAPKENLRICKRGKHFQYYIEKNKKRIYLSKKNMNLAQKIAQRDYYKKLQPILIKNTKTLNNFISNYKPEKLEVCYTKLSQGRKLLVQPLYTDNETYAQAWQAKNYERKKETPDSGYQTLKNEQVRSKSEIIIANLLNSKKIPYHYEYPVKLSSGAIIYPDFFCLNKRTRQEFYWEHCGKMDNPDYTEGMTQRIADYSKIGIIPGKNLILSLETAKTPLETKVVEDLIGAYLL